MSARQGSGPVLKQFLISIDLQPLQSVYFNWNPFSSSLSSMCWLESLDGGNSSGGICRSGSTYRPDNTYGSSSICRQNLQVVICRKYQAMVCWTAGYFSSEQLQATLSVSIVYQFFILRFCYRNCIFTFDMIFVKHIQRDGGLPGSDSHNMKWLS